MIGYYENKEVTFPVFGKVVGHRFSRISFTSQDLKEFKDRQSSYTTQQIRAWFDHISLTLR